MAVTSNEVTADNSGDEFATQTPNRSSQDSSIHSHVT